MATIDHIIQHSLFGDSRPLPFGGKEGFEAEKDGKRLASHLERVRAALKTGHWYTLAELARITGGSEAGTSARIRDLRKSWGGLCVIDKRRTDAPGIWEYRMVVSER